VGSVLSSAFPNEEKPVIHWKPAHSVVLALGIAAPLSLGCGTKGGSTASPPASLASEEEKTLYALGVRLGENLKGFRLTAGELAIVRRGIDAAATGAKPEVDAAGYNQKIGELARTRMAAGAQDEKTRGTTFADSASKEAGAERLPSGLVFTPLAPGSGATPKATSTVKVHYEGRLTDGTVFDSSVKRGQPAEFALNQVIPCWTEALQRMKIGGKARLVCPSGIAYGDAGRPPVIPGGATLVFDVELLDVARP
jgi:FKBP-type peptidyl-prolyl cis-trans isomerase